MNLPKRFLSLLVEVEPDPVVAPAPPVASFTLEPARPSKPVEPTAYDKFAAHFEALFAKSDLPGPDYYEFVKMVDAMEADIPSATARVKAAFTALKVQGVTKEKLVETAMVYIGIVREDQKVTETEAAEKTKGLASAEQSIAADEADITRLLQEVESKRATVLEKKTKLDADRERLGVNIASYQAACGAMIGQIEKDIETIKNTL